MARFWFHLNSDTFLWREKHTALIYNAKTGNGFSLRIRGELKEIIEQLLDLNNLYCITLSQGQIENKCVSEFIKKIKDTSSGNLIEAEEEKKRPIFLVPLLNLQSDIDRLKKLPQKSFGKNITTYLWQLHVHLVADDKKFLSFPKLKNFLFTIWGSSVNKIYLLGSNIFSYPFIDQLIDELDRMAVETIFCIPLQEFCEEIFSWRIFKSKQVRIRILVPENFDIIHIRKIAETLENIPINYEWEFLIISVQTYEKAMAIIDELHLEDFQIIPYYNGKNLEFFEDNVYLTEEDLQNPGLKKREVFAHQVLNTNDFGKLHILPDGKIYASLYHKPLGTIDDDVRELIYKEMDKGTSWRRKRDMKPCSDCVYRWLCPSPSDYELAIDKTNLCHVKP